jgi:DNA-directed RNA polymerase subunit alpha
MFKPLADLGLSPRVLNALRSRGIDKVGQVLTMEKEQLMSIRNFGPSSFAELKEALVQHGYITEGEAAAQGEQVEGEQEELAEALLAVGADDEGSDNNEEQDS